MLGRQGSGAAVFAIEGHAPASQLVHPEVRFGGGGAAEIIGDDCNGTGRRDEHAGEGVNPMRCLGWQRLERSQDPQRSSTTQNSGIQKGKKVGQSR